MSGAIKVVPNKNWKLLSIKTGYEKMKTVKNGSKVKSGNGLFLLFQNKKNGAKQLLGIFDPGYYQ